MPDPPILDTAVSLSTIPDEIIEQIATNLRDWHIGNGQEYADSYLLDKGSDFAHSRFDLSSFSKVCTSVRWPAERVLYRDIHVHFDGCDGIHGSAYWEWRGGSLHLLLRKLESRVDLRGRVRSVQMDWDKDLWYEESWDEEISDIEEEESDRFVHGADALQQFFSYCPSIRRLNIMTFPSQTLSRAAVSQITTVATSGRLGTFFTVVKTFPALQDLYFNSRFRFRFVDMPMPTHGFHHRLKSLRIEETEMAVSCVFWALEVCSHITENLHLASTGYISASRRRSPVLPTLSPSAGRNLQSLTLVGDELNFLAYPKSDLAQPIRQLPSLQHLHMSRCVSFHPSAFSVLPASLRCLVLFEYGNWGGNSSSRDAFIVALSKCVVQALRPIEMLVIHVVTGKRLERDILGDLSPLQCVCKDRNIPFYRNRSANDSECWENEFQIQILFS